MEDGDGMDVEEKIREELVDVLVAIYGRVDWKKMKRSISTDVFSHKLKASGTMPTIERVLEKLSYGLGVQSVFFDPEKMGFLKKHEKKVLKMIREETVYLTLLTYNKNKKLKEERKKKKKKEVKEE